MSEIADKLAQLGIDLQPAHDWLEQKLKEHPMPPPDEWALVLNDWKGQLIVNGVAINSADFEKWSKVRLDVIKRDGYTCVACGSTKRLDIHHLIARNDGGDNRPEHLITLCRQCHVRVAAGIISKALRKYIEEL